MIISVQILYSVIGFLAGVSAILVLLVSWFTSALKVKDSLISQKDEIIQEFSRTVVPLLQEMLSYQKTQHDQQTKRDSQLRESIDRFGDVVSKLVTVFTTLNYMQNVEKEEKGS